METSGFFWENKVTRQVTGTAEGGFYIDLKIISKVIKADVQS